MIFCCGAYHEPDEIYFLNKNDKFKDRRLEVLKCCPSKNNNCNAFIVELTQTFIPTGKTFSLRLKNKKAKEFVENILKTEKHEKFKIEIGSKSNMNWKWGENKALKNNKGQVYKIVQRAVDFNDKKKQSNIYIFLLITTLHNKLQLLCSFFEKTENKFNLVYSYTKRI